jgi:hypothetical protein
MAPAVVYLSHGRMFRSADNGSATEIDSPFALSIRERAFELQRRHAWKSEGRGSKFMSRSALWGAEPNDPVEMKIDITGVSRGPFEGDLFYSLQSPEISAVLLLKNGGTTEQRLLHTADFRVGHLAAQPQTGRLAMSVLHRGGSKIGVMSGDGGAFTELTQGESVDESPQWYPDSQNRIVFQSAGLARNEQGQHVGKGPYSIQAIDLDNGSMTTLAEDKQFDFLAPQIASDGMLYFIRRPYRLAEARFSILHLVEDILLFPFRLIYALFQFLNFFTMIYTGKPLSKVGPGAQQRYADEPRMILWGNLVEARRSLLKRGQDESALVPSSWELCHKKADETVEVLAKGVLSFDLEPDGNLVYSNGALIYRRSADGRVSKLHKDSMIRQVIAAATNENVAAPANLSHEPATIR